MRDLRTRGCGLLREQRLGLHHDPGRAEPALRRPGRGERLGPDAARLVGQPFLRDHVLPVEPRRLLGARDDGVAVDKHGAGSTRALGRAAFLHRAQPEVVAEQLEQALPLAWLRDDPLPVERELHRLLRHSQHQREEQEEKEEN